MAESPHEVVHVHTADNPPPHDAALNIARKSNGASHPATQHTPEQAVILLVDSELTASAAVQYIPTGWQCSVHDGTPTSNLGSVAQATHAVIWGRNDEGGRTWAESVADTVGLPCHVVTLARLPKHWSLADPLPAGRTAQQLTGYLTRAVGRCRVRAPAPAAVVVPLATAPAPQTALTVITAQDTIDVPFIRSGTRGDGNIKPIMRNAALLIEANPHRWDLRFNAFSSRVCLGDIPVEDGDFLKITDWCQWLGVHAPTAVVAEAINSVAHLRKFNPVKDYLAGLVWDEIPRLDMLFIDHAGTPDTPLIRAFTSRWLIQAVARIYEPGCQADGTLVLEGVQGLRKSSFFRQLFGDKWFTDHLPDIASKDALLQLRGVWCVEIGELATLGRAENAKIKQFLTSQVDRYRDPYGRVVADFPRTCVFAGSVNPGAGGYLKDETGARRFWPLPVTERIDTAAVGAVRDMLWAEALTRYRAHERWFLDTDALEGQAQAVSSDRYVSDPWQERIAEFLIGRTQVTVDDLFQTALKMPDVGKWNQMDMNRISRCLAFAQWVRIRGGSGTGGGWIYVPTAGATQGTLVQVDNESHVEQSSVY